MARVIRTSNAIKKDKRPRGFQDFSWQEMDVIMGAPLSAEDYERADRVMLLLMQPQVKCLLNSKPVGKTKAKNTQKGMSTLPQEFLDRPIVGPPDTQNLVSLSPFRKDRIFCTRGFFG